MGDLSWWDGAPSREQNWPGTLSNTASSLVVVAKVLNVFLAISSFFLCDVSGSFFNTKNTHQVVDDQSVVLEWKLFPSRETLSSGEDEQASQLYLPQWISATVHINNPQISYTTKVIIASSSMSVSHLVFY